MTIYEPAVDEPRSSRKCVALAGTALASTILAGAVDLAVEERSRGRMQLALCGIAPARRTPRGVVIDFAAWTPPSREMQRRIAGVLLVSSGYRIDVYGRAGDARAVADYLVAAGIPAAIVSTPRERTARIGIGIVEYPLSAANPR